MKKITITFMALLAFTFFTVAQESESYTMFENTRIKVKTDKFKEFGEAMATHNKKYHSGGTHHANLWMVSVGEHAGEFVWSMGPGTYTDLDSRPEGEDHMEDWLFNVMPNVDEIVETNYWKMSDKHTYNPEAKGNPKLSIRVFDIEDYQGYRFKAILDDVVAVYKAKEYTWTFSTYWSQFNVHEDEDVAIVFGFDKWAWFDDDRKFKDDFEEVHGDGSWQNFREELRSVIKGTKDEVWEIIPELSGNRE